MTQEKITKECDGENEDGEEKMRMMERVNQVQGVF